MQPLFSIILGLVSSLIDRTPNYEQRKREHFYQLLQDYSDAKKSGDDLLMSSARAELLQFVVTYYSELRRGKA